MDINELINWGRTIEHGLRFVPPPDGVIRLYRQYRPDNLDEYYRWKEYSIRFLNLYSPADQERFVDYSNKFEQHFLSRYISNMIGILEACESMPSEKLVKLKEEAERNSDVTALSFKTFVAFQECCYFIAHIRMIFFANHTFPTPCGLPADSI